MQRIHFCERSRNTAAKSQHSGGGRRNVHKYSRTTREGHAFEATRASWRRAHHGAPRPSGSRRQKLVADTSATRQRRTSSLRDSFSWARARKTQYRSTWWVKSNGYQKPAALLLFLPNIMFPPFIARPSLRLSLYFSTLKFLPCTESANNMKCSDVCLRSSILHLTTVAKKLKRTPDTYNTILHSKNI